jgi:hypothetical protein
VPDTPSKRTGGKPYYQPYTRIVWWRCETCRRVVNDRKVHDRWHNWKDQTEWLRGDRSSLPTHQTGSSNVVILYGRGHTSPTLGNQGDVSTSGVTSAKKRSG